MQNTLRNNPFLSGGKLFNGCFSVKCHNKTYLKFNKNNSNLLEKIGFMYNIIILYLLLQFQVIKAVLVLG